ncbi:MAG: hypothetical protein ACK56F_16310, partial [bacterium]
TSWPPCSRTNTSRTTTSTQLPSRACSSRASTGHSASQLTSDGLGSSSTASKKEQIKLSDTLSSITGDNEDDEAHEHEKYFNPDPGFSTAAKHTAQR